VAKPYLIDGLKFDLRLYVVVTSAQPLTIFWHKDGLARFATQQYTKPGEGDAGMASCAHLTNYAINKDSEYFKIAPEDVASGKSSKRTLDHVWEKLAAEDVDVQLV
jgi:tubulin polyglutamylase TTLL6/13